MKVLRTRGDRSVACLLATGDDDKQVAVKEPWLALFDSRKPGLFPPVPIALQLLEGGMHRVRGVGVANLGLHDDQGYPIHEKHNVRDEIGRAHV